MLPRQPLTVLRDKLSCPANSHLSTLNMSVPGAYFYIEGSFYNDTRQPGAVDYSEPVLKFCDEYNLMPPRAPNDSSCEACWHPRGFMQTGERPPQSGISTRTCSRSTQLRCLSKRGAHVPRASQEVLPVSALVLAQFCAYHFRSAYPWGGGLSPVRDLQLATLTL